MLGRIVREQLAPQKVVVSTRLTEALLGSMGESRPDPVPYEGMPFRCSGIHSLCPRMLGIAQRDEVGIGTKVDAYLAWIFGTGTAIHTQFQEQYLQSLGDVFQGWWKDESGNLHTGDANPEGHTLSHGWVPKPTSEGQWSYEELSFGSTKYRVTGHCDGVLVWDDCKEVFELKTINARGFDYVDPRMGGKPKAEHVLQVNAYMWLTGLSTARIVYISKDFNKRFGPEVICEHVVQRDESIIDSIKQMLENCAEAVDVGTLFERLPECTKKSDPRAKYCPMKKECFSKG